MWVAEASAGAEYLLARSRRRRPKLVYDTALFSPDPSLLCDKPARTGDHPRMNRPGTSAISRLSSSGRAVNDQ
jgi:hypothetical protein